MSSTPPQQFRRTMTGWHVAILMIGAAAPLSSMLGNVPAALIFGNGPGLPAGFLAAALLVAVLVTVYIALHRTLPDVAGFSGYVRASFGPGAGTGTAYVTMISYISATLAYAVGFGYFGSLIAASHGWTIPWWLLSVSAFVIIAVLGRRGAEVSGRAVVGLVLAEFVLLLIMCVLIIASKGGAAFPIESFTPTTVFSGTPGLALMAGLTSFIGIEAGVLYSRETKNARRAIPRAVYGALALIAGIYVTTTWIIVGGLGADQAVAAAMELEGDVVFALAFQYGGNALLVPMQVFFCGSVLASAVAMHNASSRYIADLASHGNLPVRLGRLHHRRAVPHHASDLIAGLGLVVVVSFALLQADPYIGLGTSLTGLLTIGLFGIQILVMAAAFRYLSRGPDRSTGILVATVVGFIGLIASVWLMASNYSILTGTDSRWASLLPLALVVAFLIGFVVKHGTTDDPLDSSRDADAVKDPA